MMHASFSLMMHASLQFKGRELSSTNLSVLSMIKITEKQCKSSEKSSHNTEK